MKCKVKTRSLLLVLVVCFCAATVYADLGSSYGKKVAAYSGFEGKFFYKAHFILNNEDELKLTEEQAKEIRTLKTSVQKDLINLDAKIDLISVDIKTEMWEDPMNLDMINGLVEEKYGLTKEKTKILVNSYAQLNKVLTGEQKQVLKRLWMKKALMGKY
jgi:Spy/CpxP family protein refolding chaperone